MSAKKYKPALFELVSKKSSSSRKSALDTPKWFYQKKKAASDKVEKKAESVEKQSIEAAGERDDSEVLLEGQSGCQSEGQAFSGLTFSVSYMVLAFAAVVLVLMLWVSYQLGRRSVKNDTADAAPSAELQEVAASSPRGDLVTPPARGGLGNAPTVVQPTRPASTREVRPRPTQPAQQPTTTAQPVEQPTIAARTGQCLIICSLERADSLRPLQQHFANSGIMTEIGHYGGRFVLYSYQTFESSQGTDAVSLKQDVIRVGTSYNDSRAADAPVISPSTFQSAYAVNVTRIESIN